MDERELKRGIFILFILCCVTVSGQNPIISDQFTADPTARIFEGKVYLYPSHDIPSPVEHLKEWFCMEDYHVFSSENLVDWHDHGVIVSQKNVPWVAPDSYSMWAPDCVFQNGKYYFYFPSMPAGEQQRGFAIGVATSDKPYGPFIPEECPIAGVSGIDPCVLIDDDGKAYLYWSGRGMSVAKLKKNMLEIEGEPQQIEGLPEGFKEGPFVFKRNDIYYYTFPWVREKTEVLAYATGKNPEGPFKFRGVIMDESPVECWTNHHSILKYKGQWYLFYHHNDYSLAFDKNRSVRIDSLFFNPDGSIQKVIPSLRGVGLTSATAQPIQIDRYTAVSPTGVSIDYLNKDNPFEGWKLILSEKNSWARYNRVDFGKGNTSKVKIRVFSMLGGSACLRSIEPDNKVMAMFNVTGEKEWQEICAPLESVIEGVHDLQLTLLSEGDLEIDWVGFE